MNARTMCKLAALEVIGAVVLSLIPHVPTARAAAPTPLEEALAGKYKGTTVTVNGIYGDSWADDYRKTVEDFENKTGIKVLYQTTEDETGDFLTGEIEAGRGPDVMEFSALRPVREFARKGKVVDLAKVIDMDTLRSRYDQTWLDGATVDGPDGPMIGGLWSNFYVASPVWYPKAAFDQAGYKVPATWEELLALSDQIVRDGGTPWCIENGFGGDSPGFTAALWLDEMLARTASPADYEKWRRGELPADSPQVRKALQAMADLWLKPGYVLGGREAINKTHTWEIALPMFDDPPKCWLLHQPNWMLDWNNASDVTDFTYKAFGKDYDFFPLPPVDKASGAPVLAEGHFTAMFHDRPEVRALMDWLTTGRQIEGWVKLGHHAGFSPNKDAQLDWYKNPRDRKLVELAAAAQKAGSLYIGAADATWPALHDQLWASLSGYIAGDIDLDTALKQIDAARPATRPAGAPAAQAPAAVPTLSSGSANLPAHSVLNGVWSSSAKDIFIAGSASGGCALILHYDGHAWTSTTDCNTGWLAGIWGASGNDVFAVGPPGTILHFDGKTWSAMKTGTQDRLAGVWGTSGNDVFAVGQNGAVLHYDGKSWTPMDNGWPDRPKYRPVCESGTGCSTYLWGVWGRSPSDVFAVGDYGTILHYDGKVWSPMDSGTKDTIGTAWANPGGAVFAAGDNGTILRYDGKTWSPMKNQTTENINMIWGSSDNDIFGVGSNGSIVHHDGQAWSPMNTGTDIRVICAWGNSGSDVYAVGDNGTILHYDGKTWSQMAGTGG